MGICTIVTRVITFMQTRTVCSNFDIYSLNSDERHVFFKEWPKYFNNTLLSTWSNANQWFEISQHDEGVSTIKGTHLKMFERQTCISTFQE